MKRSLILNLILELVPKIEENQVLSCQVCADKELK